MVTGKGGIAPPMEGKNGGTPTNVWACIGRQCNNQVVKECGVRGTPV